MEVIPPWDCENVSECFTTTAQFGVGSTPFAKSSALEEIPNHPYTMDMDDCASALYK